MKYHINNKGEVRQCLAQKNCPFNETSIHFTDAEGAYRFIEDEELQKETRANIKAVGGDYNSLQASKRAKFVEMKVEHAKSIGMETHITEMETPQLWKKEREEIHEVLLEKMMSRFPNAKKERKSIFSAGLPGAGKTTVLTEYIDTIDTSEYATVSSDDFKELLAEEGLVPEVEGLDPMECSTLVHNESSYLADEFMRRLSSEGYNVIYDFTCKSKKSGADRIDKLVESGYDSRDIQFVYVDIDITTAHYRAKERYKYGLNNNELGGRYLPAHVIDNSAPLVNSPHNSQNAQAVVDLFNDPCYDIPTPIIYDNTGAEPVCVSYDKFERGLRK